MNRELLKRIADALNDGTQGKLFLEVMAELEKPDTFRALYYAVSAMPDGVQAKYNLIGPMVFAGRELESQS